MLIMLKCALLLAINVILAEINGSAVTIIAVLDKYYESNVKVLKSSDTCN